MTKKEKQLYSDIDDLITFAGGYLIALKQQSKNDKLVKLAEHAITTISARYEDKIAKLYEPGKPHPHSLNLKG